MPIGRLSLYFLDARGPVLTTLSRSGRQSQSQSEYQAWLSFSESVDIMAAIQSIYNQGDIILGYLRRDASGCSGTAGTLFWDSLEKAIGINTKYKGWNIYYSFNNMEAISKEEQSQLDSALFKKLEDLTIKMPSDPSLYKDQVAMYSQMYQQQFQKLLSDIQRKNERFSELLIFLSRCVQYFTKTLAYVPKQVIDLLKNHGPNLHPYVRKKCVGSIMILRAKNILYPVETISFLLTLFNIEDKELRKILYKYILNDIRRMNKHHKNIKINQELRNFIYEHLVKNGDKMAQKSLQLMIELYRRNIWTDNRCVNVIAEGCFSQTPKIRLIASNFLIATTEPLQELEESDEDQPVNPSEIKLKKGITKNTKTKEKKIEKEKKKALRRLRKKQIQARRQNFMPIDVIYSPQDFGEKLFNFVSKKNIKFEHKLFYMALISRLIWRHRLIILPWYGSLIKYLEPKQKEVHKVLTYFAESVHDSLPDDEVETVVKHIIEKFVNDRCSEYAMTVGLNTIREVYAKLVSIINEDTMLYLASYYDYKNKNVSFAAKSLINLVREINPYLLEKKYRGRNPGEPTDFTQVALNKNKVADTIDGAELLQHKGDVPIYMDRIFTDEDFKQIRKLKRRQQEERENQAIEMMEQGAQGSGDEQGEEGDESGEEVDQGDESDEGEIDWDNCEELEEYVEGDEAEDEEDGQSEQQQEGDQQEEAEEGQEELEDGEEEDLEIQEGDQEQQDEEQGEEQDEQSQMVEQSPEKKPKKNRKPNKTSQKQEGDEKFWQQYEEQPVAKQNNHNKDKKKVKKQKDLYASESEDEQMEEEDENPHGFLSVDRVAFYKKSKTEIKMERKMNPDAKEKFKHKPKGKTGGGTSNREKQKLKPLLMLRAKKNKIRSQQKQVKLKIKNLKNQLGKVRSGKQAKKLKNKKITKAPKRR